MVTSIASLAQTQHLVALWNFNGDTLHPSVGTGTAMAIGGVTTSFSSGSGSTDPATTGDDALSLAGFPSQGKAADTAGVEFRIDTTGYQNLTLQFDWRASNTASRWLAVRISTDGTVFQTLGRTEITTGGVFTNSIAVDLRNFPLANHSKNVTLQLVSTVASEGRYQAVSGNYSSSGNWRIDSVTITGEELSTNPPGTPKSIAKIRSQLDPHNLTPRSSNERVVIEGIVNSHANLATGDLDGGFFVQDDTAGIAVLHRGGSKTIPSAGSRVRVDGILTHVNGLLTVDVDDKVGLGSITLLQTEQPLPVAKPLTQTLIQVGAMGLDPLEGQRIVLQPVSLDLTPAQFPNASGGNVSLELSDGNRFTLRIDGRVNTLINQPKPRGVLAIIGILTQSDTSDPRSSGYAILPTRAEDIMTLGAPPSWTLTSTLQQLGQPGENPLNSQPVAVPFAEQVVRPGERLEIQFEIPSSSAVPVFIDSDQAQATKPSSARLTIEPVDPNSTEPIQTQTHRGRLLFEPNATDEGSAFQWVLQATNAFGVHSEQISIYVPTRQEQSIILTEFLANPTADPNSLIYNPLKRSEVPANNLSAHDEFVELVNSGRTPVDLSQWSLTDAVALRHQFPTGSLIQPGTVVVVYGGPIEGFAPTLESIPNRRLVQPASRGDGLSLNNTSDQILLRNANSNLVLRIAYTANDLASSGSLTRTNAVSSWSRHPEITSQSSSPGYPPVGDHWTAFLEESSTIDPDPTPTSLQIEARLLWNEAGTPIQYNVRVLGDLDRSYTLHQGAAPSGPFKPIQTLSAQSEFRIPLPENAEDTQAYFRVTTDP